MLVYHVRIGSREIGVGNQVHVHPGMHAQARVMRGGDRQLERIERTILPGQRGASRLEPAVVIRIAAASHLDEQGVEAGSFRRFDERDDRGRGRERRPLHPERPHFIISRGGP